MNTENNTVNEMTVHTMQKLKMNVVAAVFAILVFTEVLTQQITEIKELVIK